MKSSLLRFLLVLSLFPVLRCTGDARGMFKVAPAGGYALTFDDDSIEAWYGIRDLLKKYQVRATFFVTNVEQLSNSQIEMLFKLEFDGHEIGFHGRNHLELNQYIRENSLDDYIRTEVIPGYEEMVADGFAPTSFAYPGGSRNKTADEELLKYFKIIRGVSESQRHVPAHNVDKIDDVFYDFDGNRIVNGLGIDNHLAISVDDLTTGFRRALDRREVLILYAHKPSYGDSAYTINIPYLEKILKSAHELGLRSFRISDLVP
ncbi:MAG: polysaccharide deacetylase family protein [FCB group bacterium]|nr:polysaccharide deacetylase family protein [FCB group bacterium]